MLVLVMLAMLLQYSRATALRYSGLTDVPARPLSPLVEPVLIDLEERTFRYFWDTTNPKNGLVPDRYMPDPDAKAARLLMESGRSLESALDRLLAPPR